MSRIQMFQEADARINFCQIVELICPSSDLHKFMWISYKFVINLVMHLRISSSAGTNQHFIKMWVDQESRDEQKQGLKNIFIY